MAQIPLRYPLEREGDDKFAGHVSFTIMRDRSVQVSSDRTTHPEITNEINLYIPQGLQFPDGVNYGSQQIDPIAGELATRMGQETFGGITDMGSAEGFIEAIKNSSIAKDGVGKLAGNIAKVATANLANKGRRYAANAIGGEGTAGLIFGSIINPNAKTTLESVSIRNFTFQFTMIPTSDAEATAIANIVKAFRTELYPAVESVGGDLNLPMFLRYPNRFWIIVDTGGEERYNLKFKPSYLTSLSASYNSGSPTYHKDGAPTETTITLTFMEESTLSKDDITDGGF